MKINILNFNIFIRGRKLKFQIFLQNASTEKKLSSGVNLKDDVLVMDNTALSVYMPSRKYRQTSDNDVSSEQVQLNRLDVNCELNKGYITVTLQFLQPFNGIIYSKGFKDDPSCK